MNNRILDAPNAQFLGICEDLYIRYGTDILHFVIQKQLLEKCGGEEAKAYDALRKYMLNVVNTNNDHSNLCNNFLKNYLEIRKPFSEVVDRLDLSLSCQILMAHPEEGGLFSLTVSQSRAVDNLRKGRNQATHDRSNRYFQEKAFEHWFSHREELLAAVKEFAAYIPWDTEANIREYYDGKATEYKAPLESIRELLKEMIAKGAWTKAIELIIVKFPNRDEKLREFYKDYPYRLDEYFNNNKKKEKRRWIIIDALKDVSLKYALLYSEVLEAPDYMTFMRGLIRTRGTDGGSLYLHIARRCPNPDESRLYVRKAYLDGCYSAAAQITAQSDKHFEDLSPKSPEGWFVLPEQDRKIFPLLLPEYRETLAAMELAAYCQTEVDLKEASLEDHIQWMNKNSAVPAHTADPAVQPIYDRIRDRTSSLLYAELSQRVKNTEPDGYIYPQLEPASYKYKFLSDKVPEYAEWKRLKEEFDNKNRPLIDARLQVEVKARAAEAAAEISKLHEQEKEETARIQAKRENCIQAIIEYEQKLQCSLGSIRSEYEAICKQKLSKEQSGQLKSLMDKLSNEKKRLYEKMGDYSSLKNEYKQEFLTYLKNLRSEYNGLYKKYSSQMYYFKNHIQQLTPWIDKISDENKRLDKEIADYSATNNCEDEAIDVEIARCKAKYVEFASLQREIQKKEDTIIINLKRRAVCCRIGRWICGISAAIFLFFGIRFALQTSAIKRAENAILNDDLVGAYTVLDNNSWIGTVDARRVECLNMIRQRMFDNGFFGELMEEPMDSHYGSVQACESGASPVGMYEKDENGIYRIPLRSYGFGTYYAPLHLPEDKTVLAIQPVDRSNGERGEIKVNVLCTDGTLLSGSAVWVDHNNVAQAAIAEISKEGIALEETDTIQNLKGVWCDDDVFRYFLNDGTILRGRTVRYENIIGFLPGKYQGDNNHPVTKDVASYFESDNGYFDGNKYGQWIAVDGTCGYEDETAAGNDTLFYPYDSANTPIRGRYVTVYDEEVKNWL